MVKSAQNYALGLTVAFALANFNQTSSQGLGMDTVYKQHWRKLAKANATVYPRAQFWADLTTFMQTATAAHTEV